MNLILTIVIAVFVLLIVAGIVALAWGIAHAPEGHEDETGFHIDSALTFGPSKPRTAKAAVHDMDEPIAGGEPVLF